MENKESLKLAITALEDLMRGINYSLQHPALINAKTLESAFSEAAQAKLLLENVLRHNEP